MSDSDPRLNGEEHVALPPSMADGHPPERLWTYYDSKAVEDRSADSVNSLVSLAFIMAAIRRNVWLWCATAIVGLLIGVGLYVRYPPAQQASTSVLLTYGPYEDYNKAPDNSVTVAQSRAVARLAVQKLGLKQSEGNFLRTYTVTLVSPSVLEITATAATSNGAVSRANTVAAEFLRYRAGMLEAQQKLAGPAAGSQGSVRTTLAVKGSRVLDAAYPIPQSKLKALLFDAAIGLVLGLTLGVGIVVVWSLTSERLYRRQDIAYALGAPVRLSVGSVRLSRWLPGRHGLTAARDADVQRITAHLGSAVSATSAGASTLAVVPVGNVKVAALSVASLAVSTGQQGKQVVLADLCRGAPAARLLGAKEPGVQTVEVESTNLIIAVPGPDNALPVGPLQPTSPQAQRSPFTKAVTAPYVSADLLLTLAALDPSLGGEHLATWATDAVVVVTEGKSSATRIHAIGELIRIAGVRLVSAVLVGTQETDESLGVVMHVPRTESPPVRS